MSTTLELTAEHREIRSVARRFLEREYGSERVRALAETDDGFDPAAWAKLSELGWPAISLSEAYGGPGYGMVERCLLLEEMGRVLLPGAFLSSAVLAGDMISLAATDQQRAALLPSLGEGSVRATVVAAGDLLSGGTLPGAVMAVADGGSYILNGSGGLTLDAQTAELFIVVAAVDDGSVGVFAAESSVDGVSCRPVRLADQTRKAGVVEFAGARVERLDDGDGTAQAVSGALHRGAVSLAAEMIGGAQRCVDMTLAYVKERYQFGAPIGSFQAIKHRCADLALMVDTAREAVLLAAEVIDRGQEAESAVVAAAKIKATEAYLHATTETIQLHGGIGYTWEHDAHLYYKRALVSAQTLGTAIDHLARLAEELGV